MAKKRLNKKVAIIGSIILAGLTVAAIFLLLRLTQNPQDFIDDAEAAWKQNDYEGARKAFGKAIGKSKDKARKVEIFFRLSEMYQETDDWARAAACWDRIVTIDLQNVKARQLLLDYNYAVADGGYWNVWKTVDSHAAELIEQQSDAGADIYRMKGRAILEMTKRGLSTEPLKSLLEAEENLNKALELEPDNIEIYAYLADTVNTKGQIQTSKGVPGAQEKGTQEAEEILKNAVENLPDNPEAHIYLLGSKLRRIETDKEKLAEMEPEFIALTEKFNSVGKTHFALAQFYSRNFAQTDKAVAAINKSLELENENVSYSLTAIGLYYRLYNIDNDQSAMQKAIDLAKKALEFPDCADKPGPGQLTRFSNRLFLRRFLAKFYTEQAFAAGGEEKQKLVELASKQVHEIGQLRGSGENPYVIMWNGRLALAKGQTDLAIQQMYAAYKQLKTSESSQQTVNRAKDPQLGQLAYLLAKVFMGTGEKGAAMEFLATAVKNNYHLEKPQALIDYAESFLALRQWNRVVRILDSYEEIFGPTDRSKLIRLQSYIGAGLFEKVSEELSELDESKPDVIRLKLTYFQVKNFRDIQSIEQLSQTEQSEQYESLKKQIDESMQNQTELIEKLLVSDANNIGSDAAINIAKYYISEEKIDKAKSLIDKFLKYQPDNIAAQVYKRIMAEPDLTLITQARTNEITEQVLLEQPDPVGSALMLGQLYQTNNQLDKATAQYKKALDADPNNATAYTFLFEIALAENDTELAKQLVETARDKNIDKCQGEYFAARLAQLEENFPEARARLDNCLEIRPVFSYGYLLRSMVNSQLGNDADAIDDVEKAYSLSLVNPLISKQRASLLYQRNRKLGDDVSPEQVAQTKEALQRALFWSKNDVLLQSFYTEYISETDPDRALTSRQYLYEKTPTMENAYLLANMAARMALKQTDEAYKKTLNDMAENAYKKAYEMAPDNLNVLMGYATFLQGLNRSQEAETLLAGDKSLSWQYFLLNGSFSQANEILNDLYQANPKDPNVLIGLLAVGRKIADHNSVIRYSNELIAIENSLTNQTLQIEALLDLGLIGQAGPKLQSLRDKNPDEPGTLFLQSWLFAKQGRFTEALQLVNRHLELDQNNAKSWRLRGQINTALSNFEQATSDLQKSKSFSDTPEVRMDLAKLYVITDQQDKAVRELVIALKGEQPPEAARSLLEEIYIKSGNFDELRRFYDETIEKYPNNLFWYGQAAQLAMKQKDYSRAIQMLEPILKQKNGQAPVILNLYLEALLVIKGPAEMSRYASKYIDGPMANLAYSHMAKAKVIGKDKDAAIQYYNLAVENAGDDKVKIYRMLRQISSTLGHPEALQIGEEQRAARPDSMALNQAMSQLCQETKQYNKASAYIDNCLKIAGNDKTLRKQLEFNKAYLLIQAFGETSDSSYLDSAIETYENILSHHGDDTSVLNNLAYLLAENNRQLDKALNYSQRAVELSPKNVNAIDTYARILVKNGQYMEGYEVLQSAMDSLMQAGTLQDEQLSKVLGSYKAKLLYEILKETSDSKYLNLAIEQYESILEKQPKNASVLNNLAYLLADHNQQLDRAQACARQAYELATDNPGVADTYAYVLIKAEQYDRADELLEESVELFQQNNNVVPATVYLHVGMVKEKLNQLPEAIDAYEQALESKQDDLSESERKSVQEALKKLSNK